MNRKELSLKNYERFCKLEGSDYIASEFALEIILELIDKFQIKDILELGLGIGSISDTVFKYAKCKEINIKYFGTEKNEFCLEVLKSNVLDYKKIELFKELKKIENKKFDFVIVDGQDNSLNDIVKYCKKNTILFVEGDRCDQIKVVLKLFPKSKSVNIISLKKNQNYAHGICNPQHFVGGGTIIFIDPTLKMKQYWLSEKIQTFIKRKLRKYK